MPHPQLEHGYILLTFNDGRRQANLDKLKRIPTSIPGILEADGQQRAMSGVRIDSIDVMEDPTEDVIIEVSTVHPLRRNGPGHYQIEALTEWLAKPAQFGTELKSHLHWCCVTDIGP